MFTNQFDYLYVEPSTYCNLKCPRCPRTESPNVYNLEHLELKTFENLLSSDLWSDISTIEYGGNYGDPLMHPKLGELIATARQLYPCAQQLIHTSGNRDEKYWSQILETMTERDSVLFSIDGLAKTNSIYRVGARWDWIEKALALCVNRVNTIWKLIVFSHNQHQIKEAIQLAKKLGVQTFLLTKSHLFNQHWVNQKGVDPLAPDEVWIAGTNECEESIEPRCQIGSMHYLSASGAYSPCCWANSNVEMQYSFQDGFEGLMKSSHLAALKGDWTQHPPSICAKKCRKEITTRSSHQRISLDLTLADSELWDLVEDFKNQ